MKRSIFLLLCFCIHLYADDDYVAEPNSLGDPSLALTTLEGAPVNIVHQCVNVITGDYTDFSTDIIVPGHEPLTLQRFFCSSDFNVDSPFQGLEIQS